MTILRLIPDIPVWPRNIRMLVSIILENSKFLETGGKFLPLKEFMFLASAPRSFRTALVTPKMPSREPHFLPASDICLSSQ